MTEPFEARSLPELPGDATFVETIRECATAITGFPHPSDHADALIWSVKWMRANPEKADVLLGRT